MNIGYDIRSFISNETGIGVYFRNLINTVIKVNKDDKLFLFSSSFKERFDRSKVIRSKKVVLKDSRIPVSIINFLWYQLRIVPFSFFFKNKIDLVHSPVPAIIPGNHKNIITVHDLCLLDRPDLVSLETIKNFKQNMIYSLNKSDRIIAVSEFTKNRIIENFGKQFSAKIDVIYHGSDFDIVKEQKPKIVLPEQYLLFIGTVEPRKNISALLKSLDKIIETHNHIKLVICGRKGWESKETFDLLSQKIQEEKVILFEYLNRSELKYLFQRAKLFVFPSIYEGFGLPILEAAYNNLPVACSDIPVFREIFNNFPVYFNHNEPDNIADCIIDILGNPKKYNEKIIFAKKIKTMYTWEKTAAKTIDLYKDI